MNDTGSMDIKESDHKRDHIPFADKRSSIQVKLKRPYGVAAKEITSIFRDPSSNPKNEAENELQTLLYLP